MSITDDNLDKTLKPDEGEEPETGTENSTTEGAEEPDEDKEPKDGNGEPGINREKYRRDIKKRDEKIAELEAQIAEAAKTDESKKALEEEIAKLKADSQSQVTDFELKLAGCIDLKAAKARLEDFEGDIEKLKEECPYLFQQEKKTGSTGLKQGGAPDAIDEKLDKAFGIKT